jgi:hypothetical protein
MGNGYAGMSRDGESSSRASCCEGWSWTGIALSLAGVALLFVVVFTNNNSDFLLDNAKRNDLDDVPVNLTADYSDEWHRNYELVLVRSNLTGEYRWVSAQSTMNEPQAPGCLVRSYMADSTNRIVGADNVGVFTLLDFPGDAYMYSSCSNTTWHWRTGSFRVPKGGFYRFSGRINYVNLTVFTIEVYRNTVLLARGSTLEDELVVTFDTFTWANTGDILKIQHAPNDEEAVAAGKIGADSFVFIKEEEFDAPVIATSAPTPAPTPAPSLGTLTPAGTRHILNSSLTLAWTASGTTTHGSLRRHIQGDANYTLVDENITLATGTYAVTLPATAGNVTYTLLDHLGVSASTTLVITAIPRFNITSPLAGSNQTGGTAATIAWSPDATCAHYTLLLSVKIAGNATYTTIVTGKNATSGVHAGYQWVNVPGATILRLAFEGYTTQYYQERAFTVV